MSSVAQYLHALPKEERLVEAEERAVQLQALQLESRRLWTLAAQFEAAKREKLAASNAAEAKVATADSRM